MGNHIRAGLQAVQRNSVLRGDGDNQEESRTRALTTHSISQTFVLIKRRAACDPLLPDELSFLIDPAEVTVAAILKHLIRLKGKRASVKTVLDDKSTSYHDLDSLELLKQFGRLWNKNETVSIKSPHPGHRKEVEFFLQLTYYE